MNLAKVINFDSIRIYRWLTATAEPNSEMYGYLRGHGVDIDHVLNLLGGAVAMVPCSFGRFGGPSEDCIVMPVLEADDVTPLDVVGFSVAEPSRFGSILGIGAVLGANSVDSPATYSGGQPCRLLRTPLAWLQAGIVGCAVVLDPQLARPLLNGAAGDLAAEDADHARDLLRGKAVGLHKLVIPVKEAA